MINTIIFDIGNVLMKFDFFPMLNRLFEAQSVRDAIVDTFFTSGNWNQLDLGLAEEEEFLQAAIRTSPELEKEIRRTFEHIPETLVKEEFAAPWILDLKKRGYRVLFLSNYSRPVMKMGPQALEFLPLMEGGVFSCDVHLCKPDPAIYKALKDKYELDFSTCVFLDDTLPNLEAANAQGLRTIHVQNHEQAAKELEQLLAEEGIAG
ncbi:MAG: HAD family phosphatase [Lachnospiraceae bacterium]|nr:HAD family phosphatase [Lachnospiraceae bacterium]